MSNKKITDLTELTTPTTDDVFPVVDIATNTTQKVQLGNLPTTPAVTSALASKQATLVSGTNIKTVNGNSVLGSGDINIPLTPPSGVSGAIQFSTGSAFASDASNLFWDDTNNRLGVGTNVPSATGHFKGIGTSGATTALLIQNNAGTEYFAVQDNGTVRIANAQAFRNGTIGGSNYFDMGNIIVRDGNAGPNGSISIGTGSAATAKLQIQGSGSTSATTSLLVQNSTGATAFLVRDDNILDFNGNTLLNAGSVRSNQVATGFINSNGNAYSVMRTNNSTGNATFDQFVAIGTTSAPNSSAALDVVSTTKGFLPPRMTTTQKNNISSPASGLVVYDSTTNKLCCYNGSTWNDLF